MQTLLDFASHGAGAAALKQMMADNTAAYPHLADEVRGISDGAGELARGDTGKFQNAVALRVNPPRSSGGKQEKPEPASGKPAPKKDPEAKAAQDPQPDDRSPLQKLADKFR